MGCEKSGRDVEYHAAVKSSGTASEGVVKAGVATVGAGLSRTALNGEEWNRLGKDGTR